MEALSLNVAQAPRAALVARGTGAQNVRFATSKDGTSLAWTATGDGPTLVKAPNWISHLELDWTTIAGAYLPDLAERTRLVRFDQRANGLSDRSVAEVSMERFVDDLEAVLEAAGVSSAPLFCISRGGPIGASFAARRPDLVSGLIVMGGFRQGVLVRSEPRHIAFTEALDAMSRTGWDDAYPSVRDHFATLLAPDAARDDHRALAEAMRASIEAEAFGRFREVVGRFDVRGPRRGGVSRPDPTRHRRQASPDRARSQLCGSHSRQSLRGASNQQPRHAVLRSCVVRRPGRDRAVPRPAGVKPRRSFGGPPHPHEQAPTRPRNFG